MEEEDERKKRKSHVCPGKFRGVFMRIIWFWMPNEDGRATNHQWSLIWSSLENLQGNFGFLHSNNVNSIQRMNFIELLV
jgi:hypothetical protein